MKIEIDIEKSSELIAKSEIDWIIESGEVDELTYHLRLKKVADVAKKIFESEAYNDLLKSKLNGKTHKAYGALISLKSAKSEWSYMPDDELSDQLERIEWCRKHLAEEQKVYEDMLTVRRSLKKEETVVNEETGGIFTRYPAYETTSSKTTLTTTFAKK